MPLTDLVIRLAALAALALHLMASLLPEEMAWGIWFYTALPPWLGWLGGLAVASLTLSPVNDALGRWLHRTWAALPGKDHEQRWFVAVSVAMAIPFWLFRIRHLRWGDADFIVKALSYTGPDRPIWTIYNWQAPLTIFTHAQLWLLLNSPAGSGVPLISGVGVDTLYAVTSVLSGVGFVYVLFHLADSLGRDRLEKGTIFGLVITTGSMQLFFGYVENYTIISLGLVLTLYLGVRCLRGETSLAWPSLALAITNAFHPSTIVLWPAMGYVGWRVAGRRQSARSRTSEWAKLIIPPILIFAGLTALMTAGGHGPGAMLVNDRPGGADGIPFVPLFQVTTEWQHYTMFSLAHLLDWANEHLLISPFGLFLLLVAFVARTARRTSAERPQDGENTVLSFLTIASLTYLLLTFVWNPDYGGRKDWDLFAPSAFVYTLLAACLLIRQIKGRHASPEGKHTLARAARLLVAASALHTLAWIYYNTIPWPPG